MTASLQHQTIEKMARASGIRKTLSSPGPAFEALLKRSDRDQKKPFAVPVKQMKPRLSVIRKTFDGAACFIVRPRGTRPDRAVLCLFGKGFILPPDSGDMVLSGEIAAGTDSDVWFPLYPMAPSHSVSESLESLRLIYGRMLKRYPAEKIRFFGASSGAGLCLSLCMYMRSMDPGMPLPAGLVLQSPPLQIPPGRKQLEKMNELAVLDKLAAPSFLENIAPFLTDGNDGWLLSPILADLTGFPPVDIFYGTHEIMLAYLSDFRNTCRRSGVPLKVHIGKGMMHCWGSMPLIPEAAAVRQAYCQALK